MVSIIIILYSLGFIATYKRLKEIILIEEYPVISILLCLYSWFAYFALKNFK